MALLVLTNGLSLWIPWLLRDAIDQLDALSGLGSVDAAASRITLHDLAWFALAMVGVASLQAIARTLSRWAMLGNSRKIVSDVRLAFFTQLQRLGATYYDTHRTGDIMSRGVNDVQILQGFYGPGVMNVLNTFIVYAAVLVLLFRIDVRLTLISLTLFPVLGFLVNRLSRRVYALSLAVQEQLAEISNRSQENISGIQQVKTYVQEDREIATFRELCAEFKRRNLAMAALRGAMMSLIGVVTGAGTLIVLFVGGRYVIQGRITFGDFVAFNAYLGLLVWPTIAMGWIINTFQRGAGAMRRIDEVMRTDPDIDAIAGERPDDAVVPEPIDGDIEVRGLTFVYEGAGDVPTLHDINLTIPRGGRVALVGPVGAGKSTLANVLARVYPVPPGTVFVGGTDITTVPPAQLRRSIGYAPQEAFLFSRSIRDNILFGHPEASEEEIARAIEISHLSGDLQALPQGLDTVVGERGFTLSGGQRQRTTLARAVAAGPRILILDDSLSSVDADTEKAILDQLDGMMQGRTSILISHRLSTLAGADRIVVLDRGRIVEQGTHQELIGTGGVYTKLFQQHLLEDRLR